MITEWWAFTITFFLIAFVKVFPQQFFIKLVIQIFCSLGFKFIRALPQLFLMTFIFKAVFLVILAFVII